MRIKRWIAVIFVGVFLSNFGAAMLILGLLTTERELASSYSTMAVLFFVAGGVFLLTGVYRLMKSLAGLVDRKGRNKELVDIAFERRYLGLGPRVVALGGGTGMSILLEGLKEYTSQITAVISVADDGGSSGRLRREFDMLPPGDIRKCLVALSDESPRLGELMRYRFGRSDVPGGGGEAELAGHSFGNLFLTVLWQLTGDFGEAVRQAGRILSIRGRVLPATLDRVSLVASHEDGSTTTGQRQISESTKPIRRVELRPKPPPASRDIIEAIDRADLVVVGPGSLYTSVIASLLIEGISEAIRRSDAVKVYVANIASQEAEARGYSLKDHVGAIHEHTGGLPFDLVLVDHSSFPPSVQRGLDASGARLVRYDPHDFAAGRSGSAKAAPTGAGGGEDEGYDLRFTEAEIANGSLGGDSILRHDPRKLARTLATLLARERESA
jgi:uncharacterized cofD-like protein